MFPTHDAEDSLKSYSNKYEMARKWLFVKSNTKNVYTPHQPLLRP